MANFIVWCVWVISAFACVARAIAVVTFRNPLYSALALIGKMGSLGLHRSEKDLEKFIADFEKEKKKGELPPGLEPKL